MTKTRVTSIKNIGGYSSHYAAQSRFHCFFSILDKYTQYIYIYTREGEIISTCEKKKKKKGNVEGFHLSVRNLESETRTLSSCAQMKC
jgi:hypothetical protein